MKFAFTVSKFVNSNAIVIVKNLATIGIGVGQTNRIDSAKQAIKKAKKISGSLWSTCIRRIFPFPDIVKICSKNKIKVLFNLAAQLMMTRLLKRQEKIKFP